MMRYLIDLRGEFLVSNVVAGAPEDLDDEIYIPHVGWLSYPADDIVLRHLREGAFEYREQAFFWSYLGPGDVVLDIGAHCGIYARIADTLVRPGGRVYAFEPNPEIAIFLRANTSGTAIVTETVAVLDRSGSAKLSKGGRAETALSSVAYALPEQPESLVQTCTIDGFLAERQIETVALVKLDVEGSELAAIRGARKALEAKSVLALMLEFAADNMRRAHYGAGDLVRELRALGYEPYAFGTGLGDFAPWEISDVEYQNILFTHDIGQVRQRVARADRENTRRARDVLNRGTAARYVLDQATERLRLLELEKTESAMLRAECEARLRVIEELSSRARVK